MSVLLVIGAALAQDSLALTLYEREDWPELALEANRLVHQQADGAELLLAAAWSRTDRHHRALDLISGRTDGDARLLGAWIWADSEPVVAEAILDKVAPGQLEESQRIWRTDTLVHLNVHLGRMEKASALLEQSGRGALMSSLDVRRRSPAAGALLSALVPGLGQAIAGDPVAATSALLLNAGLFAGLGYAISEEQWGSAGLVGLFAVGFYSGNIYGGADAAIRYNRRQRDAVVARLSNSGLPQPGPPPLTARPAVGD